MLFPVALVAVTSDNVLPVNISSATLSGDLNQHVALYQGNVVVTQGSRFLNSDQLYVYGDSNNKISSLKALGSPVVTHEVVNLQGQLAYGWANEVDYFPPMDLVKYQQNVTLTSNGNVFKGDLVTYNTVNQMILSSETKPGEVDTFILPPQDQNKKS